jgi:hypothetical protein
MSIKQCPNAVVVEGKMVVDLCQGFKRRQPSDQGAKKLLQLWRTPEHGQAELNVDDAYTTDGAGADMILRNERGEVIFATCR